MEKVFGPEGILAHHLPGYEARPGQQQMAEAVSRVLEESDRDSLVVEAETEEELRERTEELEDMIEQQ